MMEKQKNKSIIRVEFSIGLHMHGQIEFTVPVSDSGVFHIIADKAIRHVEQYYGKVTFISNSETLA